MITNEEIQEAYEVPDNRKIIEKAAFPFTGALSDEELDNCKWVGLWNAIQNFNPKRGKFTTYLYNRVRWQCLRTLKHNSKYQYTQLDRLDIGISFCDSTFGELVDGLSLEHQQLLSQRYEYGMTLKEIGQVNGYSRQTASNKIRKAILILREEKSGILP